LVVTLALTLTLSPGEREQRADASGISEINMTVVAGWFFGARDR
jgi:hypothetical protein